MGALSVRAAASRCHSPLGCMQWGSRYRRYTPHRPGALLVDRMNLNPGGVQPHAEKLSLLLFPVAVILRRDPISSLRPGLTMIV